MDSRLSIKRTLIGRANTTMTMIIGGTLSFVVAAVILSAGLARQINHRGHVIREKKVASKALKQNVRAVASLVESFSQFDSAKESLINTKDANSKIVLDALPSKYDFPALATSLEKILTDGGYTITQMSGTDNEASIDQEAESNPQPVEMPFSLGIEGDYSKVIRVVSDLERSIRPIVIDNLEVSGTSSDTKLMISARTYYQPGKNLETSTKVVK